MNRITTTTRPQLALQSYLDALLQEAAIELESSVALEDFEAAVLEEQLRDARRETLQQRTQIVTPQIQSTPQVVVTEAVVPLPAKPEIELVKAQMSQPADFQIINAAYTGRPAWADQPFECLLFDVAGLTLAVPLVSLGSIYPLEEGQLTPIFGQPDWFLGILPSQAGNLKVLDTARWVMPERYREDFRQGLQYVISVEGYEWGLAVHQVSRSIRLNPDEVKWRNQRLSRPWLAGTVIEHMCALLDVGALAELIAKGAGKSAIGQD